MKKLTNLQEILIIESIKNKKLKFINNGSSRAVYKLNNDYIVKIALEKEGILQNNFEIESYEKYGYTGLFAEIQAYGQYIVIMEYVEIDNENLDMMADEYFEELDQLYEEVYNAIGGLIGESGDNYQIGINKKGDVVIYDYGFNTLKSCMSQIGNIRPLISNPKNFEDVIAKLR